jgi:Domain of unknown function (DUF3291)
LGIRLGATLENGALRAGGARGVSACHLAQFNIARIRYPLDDPRMAEFVENVARVNALAEQIDGFVWRLQDGSGHAMNMRVYDDPAILPNLTLWQSAAALERFVWQTVHGRFYRRREDWFERIEMPLVLWWVPAGHRPTLQDGVERLEYLKAQGASDHAFGWESLPDAALWKTQRGVKLNGRAA